MQLISVNYQCLGSTRYKEWPLEPSETRPVPVIVPRAGSHSLQLRQETVKDQFVPKRKLDSGCSVACFWIFIEFVPGKYYLCMISSLPQGYAIGMITKLEFRIIILVITLLKPLIMVNVLSMWRKIGYFTILTRMLRTTFYIFSGSSFVLEISFVEVFFFCPKKVSLYRMIQGILYILWIYSIGILPNTGEKIFLLGQSLAESIS